MKSKEQKRNEAQARNEKWAAMSPEAQLNHLNALKLRASKQRKKLGQIDDKKKVIIPVGCIN